MAGDACELIHCDIQQKHNIVKSTARLSGKINLKTAETTTDVTYTVEEISML